MNGNPFFCLNVISFLNSSKFIFVFPPIKFKFISLSISVNFFSAMLTKLSCVSSKSFSAMRAFVINAIRNKAGKRYYKANYYQRIPKITRKHGNKTDKHKCIS